MVVVGDNRGRVGIGLGKGSVVPDAVRKANTIARRDLILVPLKGNTIPHSVRAHYGASRVIIKPAPAGAGIVAGGALRAVMEAVGVRDVVAKALGSRNPINLVKATLEGLKLLQGRPSAAQSEIRSSSSARAPKNEALKKPPLSDRLPIDSTHSNSEDSKSGVNEESGSVSVGEVTIGIENTSEAIDVENIDNPDDNLEKSKES
jgi:small subunit ribosomal protein S5